VCINREVAFETAKLPGVLFDYANTHPASPLALYAIKNSIPWNLDSPSIYLTAISKLSDTVKNYPEAIAYKKLLWGAQNFHIGMDVENFDQLDTAGNIISLRSFKSKFVLLYFWNSSSLSGFNIHNDMLQLWEKYKTADFTIIAIGLETAQSKRKWLRVIREYKTPWPHLTDFKGISNSAAQQFGVISLPFNLLINPERKVILKNGTINEIDQLLLKEMK